MKDDRNGFLEIEQLDFDRLIKISDHQNLEVWAWFVERFVERVPLLEILERG